MLLKNFIHSNKAPTFALIRMYNFMPISSKDENYIWHYLSIYQDRKYLII